MYNLVNTIRVMEEAFQVHRPARTFALFSGGHDSLCSTHLAMQNGAQEVLHINTGIGIEQTREFVRETCRSFGWPLKEVKPPALTYEEFVLKHGFPGPAAHRYAYSWLKERALRIVVREAKVRYRDRIALVTGVRSKESARRMGYVQPIVRTGCSVWVAPLFEFTALDITDYIIHNKLPRNPVVDLLHMSGECLCGAFAHPGEIKELELWFPEVADEIHQLERKVAEVGKPCVWGVRPSGEKQHRRKNKFMPLCVGCEEQKAPEEVKPWV